MTKLPRIAGVFGQASGLAKSDAPKSKASAKPALSKRPEPTHTISLRVTDAEKARLEKDAAGMSRSAYIREKLFGDVAKPRKTRGKHPVKDYEALGRVLGLLGRSKLAHDLNQLDWAVRNDAVRLDAATAEAIRLACTDVAAMRDDLVTALGLKAERTL